MDILSTSYLLKSTCNQVDFFIFVFESYQEEELKVSISFFSIELNHKFKTKYQMNSHHLLRTLLLCFACLSASGLAAQHVFTVQTSRSVAKIQPTMYGVFFEDINFGADGGLYADMVENRSFEFPQHLMGWNTFGKVSVDDQKPAFDRNPHYVTLLNAGHGQKFTGIENHGYFGMGLKKNMGYDFSVYARLNDLQGKDAKLRVELVGSDDEIIAKQELTVNDNQWKKYTVQLKSNKTDAHAFLRIFLDSDEGVNLDQVSLFPADNWHGLRADLVQDLKDLHPGVFRFPGGCIVEGTDLATRYQWKNSVGPVENRPLNENRWNYTFPYRLYPNYYQSYGLGFYEYFLLSEYIGASPLPVLNCGMACQFQNKDTDEHAHVSLQNLQPYIDDALDLIEFANGDVNTKWGRLRADMGHPKPFHLKEIAIGNEQWGPLFPERLAAFVKQIRAKYPYMKICGSAGPSASGKMFDYGWEQMRKLGVDLVDEHYYMSPKWFLSNANRYDKYSRKGPKVFAGEYAVHGQGEHNNLEAALSEAAFMTGLERNADVVYQSTYAPLFAHIKGWQWKPNLIWFDNLKSLRTVNWYVQMMYGTNKGTDVLRLTENDRPIEGADGLYATACYDRPSKNYIVKVVNTGKTEQSITIVFQGLKHLNTGKMTILHSDNLQAENTLNHPDVVVPVTSVVEATGNNVLTVKIPAESFVVYRF